MEDQEKSKPKLMTLLLLALGSGGLSGGTIGIVRSETLGERMAKVEAQQTASESKRVEDKQDIIRHIEDVKRELRLMRLNRNRR